MDRLFLSLMSMPVPALISHIYLYIDPGTGSIILQALAAAVAGVAITVKLYWHRIMKFFGSGKNIDEDPKSTADDL